MKLQRTGLQTNIGMKKALASIFKSGPAAAMGATSPAWALRQEPESQGFNQSVPCCPGDLGESLDDG